MKTFETKVQKMVHYNLVRDLRHPDKWEHKWDMGIVTKGMYMPVRVAGDLYGNDVPGLMYRLPRHPPPQIWEGFPKKWFSGKDNKGL